MHLTQTFTPKTSETGTVQAVRFIGYTAYLRQILEWLPRSDYPELIGNALEPDSLRHPDDQTGDWAKPKKGHYIDPDSGVLLLRNPEGDAPVPVGWWLVQNERQEIQVLSPERFRETFRYVHSHPIRTTSPIQEPVQ